MGIYTEDENPGIKSILTYKKIAHTRVFVSFFDKNRKLFYKFLDGFESYLINFVHNKQYIDPGLFGSNSIVGHYS